jgi:membrane protease YdiL (CAAX protease family)
MTPGVFDHAIAFTIVVLMPVLSIWSHRGMLARMRTRPERRWREYLAVIANQWTFLAVVLGAWFALGRDAAALGLDLPTGVASVVGLAIAIIVAAALWQQTLAVRRGDDAAREALRAQLADVQELMPRTAHEARWFRAMAVTAGVCEEVLYRGFLIAYGAAYLGSWPAVVAGAVVFGAGHLYQSRANALKGAVFSLLAGALYVGCGSLLWPILVHAALDLHGGAVGRFALEEPRRASP